MPNCSGWSATARGGPQTLITTKITSVSLAAGREVAKEACRGEEQVQKCARIQVRVEIYKLCRSKMYLTDGQSK